MSVLFPFHLLPHCELDHKLLAVRMPIVSSSVSVLPFDHASFLKALMDKLVDYVRLNRLPFRLESRRQFFQFQPNNEPQSDHLYRHDNDELCLQVDENDRCRLVHHDLTSL